MKRTRWIPLIVYAALLVAFLGWISNLFTTSQDTLPYSKVVVYYEDYVSLGVQDIKSIDLMSSMRDMSKDVESDEEIMTAEDTIFEPSLDDIADEMEMTMMTLTMSQTILDLKLEGE